ncbi:MAG TPA: glycosyltransferase 87 family protein [Ktedonobacterales bacterium]
MRSPAPVSGSASAPTRLPRWSFPLVTALSLLLGATSVVRGTRAVVTITDSDLTNFFLKSADYILNGQPFQMYAVRADLTYPNYNPPLSIFLMAPLLGLARALGFAGNYGAVITFVTLPFIILVPVLGYLCLRALDRLYPGAPEAQRLLVYGLVTLSPLTWQTYSIWYHVEQPLMLCLLIGAVLFLQRQRPELAGLLGGLAFLTRTTALIPLIALGLLLALTKAWRALAGFGGVSATVAALGLAPFFLFDRADAMYTFVSWRSSAQIGSDSIWALFAYTGSPVGTLNHLRYLLDGLAKRLDMYTVILVVAVAVWLAARRWRLTALDEDVWALVALAALATPMLSKQVWPYYYLEPFVFIVIWEFATMRDRVSGLWRWPILSVGFLLVAGTFSQYIQLQSVGRGDAIILGVTQTGAMALVGWAIWRRMGARKSRGAAGAMGSDSVLALMTPEAGLPRSHTRGGFPAQTPPGGQAAAPRASWSAPQPVRGPIEQPVPPRMPIPAPYLGQQPAPGASPRSIPPQTPPPPARSAPQPGAPLWPGEGGRPPQRPAPDGQQPGSSPLWPPAEGAGGPGNGQRR